jgi:hypothetical protein
MRLDRDAVDRMGRLDRMSGIGYLQSLAAYLGTSGDEYARLQISHLLAVPDTIGFSGTSGREHLDRAGLDRRYTRTVSSSHPDYGTLSSLFDRLRIDHNLAGYLESKSDVHAALLLALAAYIESNSSVYARLQIAHNIATELDTESDVYARLQIAQFLKSYIGTESNVYARLQIAHNIAAYLRTNSSLYAQLRQIDSWTFTFSGSLAAGKTLCINMRDFTVKNDGVNAIANFTGDFPSIFPGTNWVIYTDSEGSRTLRLVVSKRDRKV